MFCVLQNALAYQMVFVAKKDAMASQVSKTPVMLGWDELKVESKIVLVEERF